MKKLDKINCNNCSNLFVTHDPKRRWGCKFFGFKSNFFPSSQVFKITGMECAYFKQKTNKTLMAKDNLSSGRLA